MPFAVGDYGREFELPWTEVFGVSLYQHYDWAEGRVFVHDEDENYAWVTDSGCSCNHFLSDVSKLSDVDYVTFGPLHTIVPDVLRYIEGDANVYDSNGPDWVVSEKARFNTWLKKVQ